MTINMKYIDIDPIIEVIISGVTQEQLRIEIHPPCRETSAVLWQLQLIEP